MAVSREDRDRDSVTVSLVFVLRTPGAVRRWEPPFVNLAKGSRLSPSNLARYFPRPDPGMSASGDLRCGRKSQQEHGGGEVPVGRLQEEEPGIDEEGISMVEGKRNRRLTNKEFRFLRAGARGGGTGDLRTGSVDFYGHWPGGRGRSAELSRTSRFSTRESKICLPLNNRNSLFVTLRLVRLPGVCVVSFHVTRRPLRRSSSRGRFPAGNENRSRSERETQRKGGSGV